MERPQAEVIAAARYAEGRERTAVPEPHGPFDRVLSAPLGLDEAEVRNLAQLLFRPLPGRDERSEVILGHDGPRLVRVSLPRLRFVASRIFEDFRRKDLRPGMTVLLANIPGNNELFLGLLFCVLAAYGVRTLVPMFMETAELEEWLDLCDCAAAILPEQDVGALEHHEKGKAVLRAVKETVLRRGLPCYDSLGDFRLRERLFGEMPGPDGPAETPEVAAAIASTGLSTEALLVSTSGSSGKSKLAVYEQGAFIRSCLSWQKAGFFDGRKLGGRGFTPLLTHTMGVRAFFNALWTGSPVCLITTDWFEERPETVRYFLLQMRPEHVTGGPAVYQLLLELARNFPELKDALRACLKTVVLSGAPNNGRTAAEVASAFGLLLHNAFGMTETQQVLSTLLFNDPSDEDLASLGRPLPGVAVGLKRLPEGGERFRLFVKSPFGAARMLGETPSAGGVDGFLDSGDNVRLAAGDRLLYEGREGVDFFKDGFGVKIPLPSLARHYEALHRVAAHVEYLPLKDRPGLAALVFLEEPLPGGGTAGDAAVRRRYSRLVAEINTHLSRTLEPFESRHRSIRRLALVAGPVPRTVKGGVSRSRIRADQAELIEILRDPQADGPGIETVGGDVDAPGTFTRFLNPYVGRMLSGLKLDVAYHRARKDSLFTFEDGREVEVLDLVGGYGGNLLGHANEDVKGAVVSFLAGDGVPLASQGSIQTGAGDLAEELADTVGGMTGRDYAVMFGSSGAEAVEIALHHAALEWRARVDKLEEEQFQHFGEAAGPTVSSVWRENRRALDGVPLRVIALKSAFHGNTSGPRSLQGHDEHRRMFGNITGLRRSVLDDQAPDWRERIGRLLEAAKVRVRTVVPGVDGWRVEDAFLSTIVAAIAEPIIGEGGVRTVDPDVLRELGGHEFPLILDEIQCGLGRSGGFLASEGVAGDYYLFGKSLGGNVEKISAVLVDRKRFRNEIGKYYVSTFANGELAAQAARATLAVIRRDGVPERARVQGDRLVERLSDIQRRFPAVIAEITGRGLMLGVRFGEGANGANVLFRILAARKALGYVFSAYLFRRWRVRVLPTLSAPNTLRIEPSAYITDEEIDRVASAFEDLARQVGDRRAYELFRPLMDGDPFEDHKGREARPGLVPQGEDEPAGRAARVAFIAHFSRPAEELRIIERDFAKASDTGLRILFNRLQSVLEMKPVSLYARNLFGGRVHFRFIALPADSAELERLHRLGQTRRIVARIQEAVDLAARAGATVIGLGGYASILTRNGSALVEPEGTRIVTGNTLTAASALYRLKEEIQALRRSGARPTLGIVGASGNIGAIIAETMMKTDGLFAKIVLMDRRKKKLEAFVSGLDRGNFTGVLETAADLRPLKRCDVIAVAANTNDPIIFPHLLKDRDPVLVADVSIPPALAAEVARRPNVRTLPFASYVTLPEDPDFVISSHTPRGTTFCCAAETMLCGLETLDVPLRGKIAAEAIALVMDRASRYGFFEGSGPVAGFRPER
jgi:acetylornithine/succinyldiaminopimelate/putrescine aminotransferase/predicted amino acid dehydrogenase/acyl-CoA synthetase (AMP-forming)/AMP-acid ligase II